MRGKNALIAGRKGIVLAVTGPSGAGKSTAVSVLKQAGFAVLDADLIARSLYNPGSKTYFRLLKIFGSKVVGSDGKIDRRWLGHEVFKSNRSRNLLNRMMFPVLCKELRNRIVKLKKQRHPKIALDMAVFFEAGAKGLADQVWLITAPLKLRAARLVTRHGLTRLQALRQTRALRFGARERSCADQIIENLSSTAEFKKKIKAVLDRS
jgi:dephospho-CoA kinase